ncbi:MAG: hypothetical protein SGJ27_05715 [Candidatus Melainabacteria bacterium]|nr:hypothetical protein [Candidatus Melainabacteria bacterium]
MVEALLSALKWVVLCLLPFYLGSIVFICTFMWLTTGADQIVNMLPLIAILNTPLAFMMAAQWSLPHTR